MGLVIDDFEHSLQTATRAERAGADPELVVAALLNDAGKAVTVRDLPQREHIDVPVRESLIVELYSK